MDTVIHPNLKLLSHSSSVLLHKCPRKFQLYRLMKKVVDDTVVEPHLDFGHWVGRGIQHYLITGNYNAAVMEMFTYCRGDLFDDDGKRDNKTFFHALVALDKFVEFRQTELQHYEVLQLTDGTYATELGFILECFDGFTYRGLLDALLINSLTNELVVLECKTSKYKNVHEAQYKNSGQGLGYSLITDIISQQLTAQGREVGSSWKVLYPIYKAGALEWEAFYFPKSNTERSRWLQTLIRDIQHIAEYAAEDYFPMHGENCYDFFRPCEYFGVCDMSDGALIGPLEAVKVVKDDEKKYAYRFKLEDVILSQQIKVTETEG